MSRHSGSGRRWTGPFLGMLVAVFTVAGVPGALRSAGALSCAESPGDRVAVVIDFGDAPGAPSGVWAKCVQKPPTMRSGLQALRAATDGRIGHDASSKVCQINGIPATWDAVNCSAPRNGKVSYWAYFRGSANGWTYSGVGAAGVRADPAVVEGWRFVTLPVSQSIASAPPPRNLPGGASYRWRTVCPAAPPPTAPGPAPTAAPAPTAPGGDLGAGHAAPPDRGGRTPDVPTPPSDQRGGRSAKSEAPTTSTSRDRTTTTNPTTVVPPTTVPEPEGTPGLRSSETARRLTDAEVAEAARQASGDRRTGAVAAAVAGSAVVVAGLVLVTLRSRHRRARDGAGDSG